MVCLAQPLGKYLSHRNVFKLHVAHCKLTLQYHILQISFDIFDRDWTFKHVAGPADDGQCIFSLSANQVFTYQTIVHRALDSAGQPSTKWSTKQTSLSTPTVIAALPFNGVNIARATSTTTLAIHPSGSSASTPGTLSTITIRASPSSLPRLTGFDRVNSHRSPPSTMAAVVIGAGSGAGVIILAGLIIWLIRMYRRYTRRREQMERGARPNISWPLELRREVPGEDSRFEVHGEHKRFELSCNAGLVHELGQTQLVLELECNQHTRHSAQELPAGPWIPIHEPYETSRELSPVEEVATVDAVSPL
jgi:hypothetical protein